MSKPFKRIKSGKKVNRWNYIRRILKTEFSQMGIERCEVCGSDSFLSFAHRRKRRFITDDVELKCVALLCIAHHEEYERLPHDLMYERITEIIERRNHVTN